MKVTLIIVTYNGVSQLAPTLASVRGVQGVELSVVVVDNASTDGTVAMVRRELPEARVIVNERNVGFGKANNQGMRIALAEGADYVYLLNQDAWLEPDTITRLIDIQRRHPDYGVVSPAQVLGDRKKPYEGYRSAVSLCPACLDDMIMGCVDEIYQYRDAPAAHWLMTCESLRKVGLFSPSFTYRGEDNELGMRFERKGIKVGIAPGVVAVHDHRDAGVYTKRQEAWQCYVNAVVRTSVICPRPRMLWLRVFVRYAYEFHYGCVCLRFKNLWRLLGEIPQIERNRRAALGEGAFI